MLNAFPLDTSFIAMIWVCTAERPWLLPSTTASTQQHSDVPPRNPRWLAPRYLDVFALLSDGVVVNGSNQHDHSRCEVQNVEHRCRDRLCSTIATTTVKHGNPNSALLRWQSWRGGGNPAPMKAALGKPSA